MKLQSQKIFFTSLMCVLIFCFSYDIGFFWDNVLLSSKMGLFLYHNGLFSFNFPQSFDPGHPPFISFVNAVGWKLIDKKLWVSHFVFLPFLFGFIWQLEIFISNFINKRILVFISVLIVFSDPTILSQTFYIGQEIPQMFFFLLALNSLIKNKFLTKCIALLFLSLCSVRGMLLCGGFLFFEIYYRLIILNDKSGLLNKKNFVTYFISGFPSLLFIFWRIYDKGYFLIHSNSEYIEYAQFASIKKIFFNLSVIVRNYLDFGRFVVIVIISFFLFSNKIILKTVRYKLLISVAFFSVLFILIICLIFTNPISHRYFCISYTFLNIFSISLVINYIHSNRKWFLISTVALILIGGNFWKYPQYISQGWDASLRGVSYFKLRRNMIDYIVRQKISPSEIGTFFPNDYSDEEINVTGDTTQFPKFNWNNQFVLYSNIYNIKPKTFNKILINYQIIKKYNTKGIEVVLMRRNNNDKF